MNMNGLRKMVASKGFRLIVATLAFSAIDVGIGLLRKKTETAPEEHNEEPKPEEDAVDITDEVEPADE